MRGCARSARIWRHAILAATTAAILTITGCGSEFATVTGTVTLDGEPLAGGPELRGTVYFYPEGGAGAPGVGILDSSGQYSLQTGSQEGVRPGPYVVAVSATQIIMPTTPGGMPAGKPITPRKYGDARQSGFRADVQPGSNTFDFPLVSTPSPR